MKPGPDSDGAGAGQGRTNYRAYQEMPYEGCAHGDTDPARIWTIATLRGLTPPDPRTARVLEIGCARGRNLIPMAARLPEARFVGLDVSDRHIADSTALAQAAGLRNVELRVGDVADFDDPEPFDYIIAHGVYSWIAPRAQAALRRLCGRALTDDGVAHVSHNVKPGWQRRQAMRDMMLYHVRALDEPSAQVAAARGLLKFLATASSPQDQAYKLWLHAEYETLTHSSDDYVFHEHLAVHNAPSYLHEVVADFQEHGLEFVADGYLPSNFGRLLPEALARDLTRLAGGQRLAFEQYQDFVINRAFRKTLFARKTPAMGIDPERWLTAHAMSACEPGEGPRTWRIGDHVMADLHPSADALLARLAARWPGTVPINALFEAHVSDGFDPSPDRASPAAFCRDLFMLAMNEIIEVTPIAIEPEAPRAQPRVFPWVAAELAAGLGRQTTLHHRSVAIPQALRCLAELADGTRDHAALAAALRGYVDDGRLPLPVDGATPDEVTRGLSQGVERGVARLRRMALAR